MKLLTPVILAISLVFVLSAPAAAQEMEFEEILESVSKESNVSQDLDILEYYSQNPIILRRATAEKLNQLPGISYSTALQIIDLVQNRVLSSIPEICDSLTLSAAQAATLESCARIDYPSDAPDKTPGKYFFWRARDRMRLNEIKGFREGNYQGSPLDLYQRLTYVGDHVSTGLLTDKDAGERYLSDFYGGYAKVEYPGVKAIIGDFYVEAGMGSLLWKSFGARKGSDAVNPALQYSCDLRPYRLSLESNFFRGAALELSSEDAASAGYKAILWASSADRGASLDPTGAYVVSLPAAGLYRTETEIEKQNAINEKACGAMFEISAPNFSAGLAGLYLDYAKPVYSGSKSAFYGKSGLMASAFSRANIFNLNAGVEISRDARGALGVKAGVQRETRQYGLAFFYRRFSSDFRAPFGYGFGESSQPANESGFYAGFIWKGFDRARLSVYADIYSSIAETRSVPAPVRGFDFFAEGGWKIDDKTSVLIRLRYEEKTDFVSSQEMDYGALCQPRRSSIRLEVKRKINSKLNIRFRFETAALDFEGFLPLETGAACFAEASYKLSGAVKFGGRASLFSADSYSSAIWQYEYALPGYMTTTALYGDGLRAYAFVNIKPTDFISVWVRYSATVKNNVAAIGSGLDEVQGNANRHLFLQMDIAY